MTLKLAQTLAGNWVITVPNPEERGWETQLAEFSTDAVSGEALRVMEEAMIATFVALICKLDDKNWEVTSHDQLAIAQMTGLVQQKLQETSERVLIASAFNTDATEDDGWIRIEDEKPPVAELSIDAKTFLAYCEDEPNAEPFPCIRSKFGYSSEGSYYRLDSVDRDGDYNEVRYRVTHWKRMVAGPRKLSVAIATFGASELGFKI